MNGILISIFLHQIYDDSTILILTRTLALEISSQISGAKVLIHDPKPGAMEGIVIVSGTTEQTHAAQCLIQAFILCGQTPP